MPRPVDMIAYENFDLEYDLDIVYSIDCEEFIRNRGFSQPIWIDTTYYGFSNFFRVPLYLSKYARLCVDMIDCGNVNGHKVTNIVKTLTLAFQPPALIQKHNTHMSLTLRSAFLQQVAMLVERGRVEDGESPCAQRVMYICAWIDRIFEEMKEGSELPRGHGHLAVFRIQELNIAAFEAICNNIYEIGQDFHAHVKSFNEQYGPAIRNARTAPAVIEDEDDEEATWKIGFTSNHF